MAKIYEVEGWIDLVQEEILDPNIEIIDPHHHLWHGPEDHPGVKGSYRYLLEDLWKDTSSGHNIKKTVFIDCGQEYYQEGPEQFKPVGETEFVVEIAKQAQEDLSQAQIAGIIGHANMMLGSSVKEVLELHLDKGEGLFRGIRHAGGWDKDERVKNAHSHPTPYIYLEDKFQDGLRELSSLGMVFDTWHYHNQIKDLTKLANNIPELVIIHDHFGGPLGIGPYIGKREEIFEQWKEDIYELSRCKNVYAKLGGLAMPVNGWDWHKRDKPASSDEIVSEQGKYYLYTLECFGPERCMFESNFPVDKQSVAYHIIWNAYKKMVKDYSEKDKFNLFFGTAEKVYKL
jgi:predicted TIM-barrel fold metal-dependent hydrolase